MRNSHLKTVRNLWKECVHLGFSFMRLINDLQRWSHILWKMRGHVKRARRDARNGASVGAKPGRSGVPLFSRSAIFFIPSFKRLKGQTGLFFTSYDPTQTEEWFEDFKAPDFARAGNVADRDVILPVGTFFSLSIYFILLTLRRPHSQTNRTSRVISA